MSGIMNKLGLGHHDNHNNNTTATQDAARTANTVTHPGQTINTTTTTSTGPSLATDLPRNAAINPATSSLNNSSYNNSSLNNSALHTTNTMHQSANHSTLGSTMNQGLVNNNSALNTSAPYGTSTNNMTARTGAAYTGHQTATAGMVGQDQQLFTQNNRLSGDDAMTRSEEQLRVAKAQVASGVAALDKTVEIEHVERAIPVQRERIVIEREPITCNNLPNAMSGPEISEAHYETILKEDRVAATKETVPVERIRLAKQVETKVETVGADLRKEHVDLTMHSADNVKTDLARNNLHGDKFDTTARSGLAHDNTIHNSSNLHNTSSNIHNTRNI